MPSTSVAVPEDKQPYASRPGRIDKLTPRVRKAIELMVWHGKPFNEAAAEVSLTSRAMRLALGKPHVIAAMKKEMQVLIGSHLPRNIHRLVEIREAAPNMPAVQAIDRLMQAADGGHSSQSGASASPGITIRIINQAPTQPMIDVTPDRNDAVSHSHMSGDE